MRGHRHNYREIDGYPVLKGEASTWDDLSVNFTPTVRGANNLPDFDYTEIGLLFPQNKTDEIIYAVRQMKHHKKFDTPIYPHIHYMQDEVEVPVFKLSYRYYNNNSVPPSWTTISTVSTPVFTYASGNLLQILAFPSIAAPANENVSANFDIKLWRDDNVVTGDVLAKYFDIHYEIDTMGSAEQYVK